MDFHRTPLFSIEQSDDGLARFVPCTGLERGHFEKFTSADGHKVVNGIAEGENILLVPEEYSALMADNSHRVDIASEKQTNLALD